MCLRVVPILALLSLVPVPVFLFLYCSLLLVLWIWQEAQAVALSEVQQSSVRAHRVTCSWGARTCSAPTAQGEWGALQCMVAQFWGDIKSRGNISPPGWHMAPQLPRAHPPSCLPVAASHLCTSWAELSDRAVGPSAACPVPSMALSVPGWCSISGKMWIEKAHTYGGVCGSRDRAGEALLAGGVSSGPCTVPYHVILFFNLLFIYF